MKIRNFNRYRVSGTRGGELYERVIPATSEQDAILKATEFQSNIIWDTATLIRRRII